MRQNQRAVFSASLSTQVFVMPLRAQGTGMMVKSLLYVTIWPSTVIKNFLPPRTDRRPWVTMTGHALEFQQAIIQLLESFKSGK